MSDLPEEQVGERNYTGFLVGLGALALLVAIGGLIWSYKLSSRLDKSDAALMTAQAQNEKLSAALDSTNAELKVETQALSKSVGLTQQQLEERASELLRRQDADARRLANEQKAASAAATQQIGAVSSQVSSVQTDVGGVKTDVAQTKTALQQTQAQLTSMKGDLGIQSGLIATNHDELEILKHKGDRNYFEFTLQKGAKPTLLSTIKLQLKKADEKHSKYTLNVSADDRNIEKKDKNLDEPVQFYTGKDPVLYEIVVNVVEKNKVSGYLATPKGTAQPASSQ